MDNNNKQNGKYQAFGDGQGGVYMINTQDGRLYQQHTLTTNEDTWKTVIQGE